MTHSTTATPTLAALRHLVGDVADLVDQLDETTWDAPSPCPELSAHELVEHLVAGLDAFARVADGTGAPDFTSTPLSPPDAAHAYRAAAVRAVSSWAKPGRLERAYAMPWGESSGGQLVGFLVLEQAAHGWDLARALDLPAGLDPADVAVADAVARAMVTDEMRVPGMFGPEVAAAPDASPLHRLVAFLGRTP